MSGSGVCDNGHRDSFGGWSVGGRRLNPQQGRTLTPNFRWGGGEQRLTMPVYAYRFGGTWLPDQEGLARCCTSHFHRNNLAAVGIPSG